MDRGIITPRRSDRSIANSITRHCNFANNSDLLTSRSSSSYGESSARPLSNDCSDPHSCSYHYNESIYDDDYVPSPPAYTSFEHSPLSRNTNDTSDNLVTSSTVNSWSPRSTRFFHPENLPDHTISKVYTPDMFRENQELDNGLYSNNYRRPRTQSRFISPVEHDSDDRFPEKTEVAYDDDPVEDLEQSLVSLSLLRGENSPYGRRGKHAERSTLAGVSNRDVCEYMPWIEPSAEITNNYYECCGCGEVHGPMIKIDRCLTARHAKYDKRQMNCTHYLPLFQKNRGIRSSIRHII